ncbi:MAG: transposase [Clostridiales bacterium]|nr:transposase [Clostridiales bacterium]
MNIFSSYKVKIKHYNHIFEETVTIYRNAVSYFIDICDKEWNTLEPLKNLEKCREVERLTLSTKKNPEPKYDFNSRFYKMPSYLRRSAINTAIGCYSSYCSNLQNWNYRPVGKKPTLQLHRNVMPTLYKDNMYVRTDTNTARIKIFHKNDWVWLDVELNNQDVKYIKKHCAFKTEYVPTLKKQGKCWYLVFPFEDKVVLPKTDVENQLVCAVDLGLNNNATCSIMQSDGTVVARKFINLGAEKDHLNKALHRVKKAQQNGAKKCPTLWKHVNDINTDISRKTARQIIDFAVLYSTDVIVFEYLDTQGKKKGHGKQRLTLWRKQEIQKIVEHQAHICGIRISRICAWNTSRLAYDGSGKVERGTYIQNGIERYNYSICTFQNGKQYHCDLNAAYNIGARYFIRELLKSDSVMRRLPSQTKDSGYGTGSTRTLSTLIRLNADVCGMAA